MIDKSVLPEKSLALPAPKPAVKDDDALFVSDDENEIPAPSVTIDKPVPETTMPPPTSGFQNGFPAPTSQSTGIEPPAGQAQQAAPVSQPSPPPNPFSSMFSGNFGGAPAAPPSTAPNPFASVSSPFASLKQPPANQAPGPFSLEPTPEKPNNMFNTTTAPNPFATAGQRAPASTTPPFQFPSAPQPPAPQLPASSPFGIPTTSTATNQTSGVAAGQPPKSLFDSVKPPAFPSSTSSLFNLSGPSTAPKEPSAQDPQTTVSKPAPGPSLFAPKQDGKIVQNHILSIHYANHGKQKQRPLFFSLLLLPPPPPHLQPLFLRPRTRLRLCRNKAPLRINQQLLSR